MIEAILWVAAIKAAGAAAFPLFWPAFRKLPDRGYGVAPIAALTALCWATWAVGNLGVAPAGRGLALLALAALAYLGWRQVRGRKRLFLGFLRAHWRGVLAVEVAFLSTFALWTLVASENPAVDHTEKPMDFAIMNSIVTSNQVPPPDVWLSGEQVVYYYGGHYAAAFLSQATGIDPEYSYNLTVPGVAALAAGAIVALAYNLSLMAGLRRRAAAITGLATCGACLVLSNGMGMVEWISARGWGGDWFWGWIAIKDLPAGAAEGFFPDGFWWWWRSTRVIDTIGDAGASLDYTITEFPMFSFLLGDLHAHVSALPLAVLALTVALALLACGRAPEWRHVRRNPLLPALAALTLAALGFTNTWDFPLHLGVMTLMVALVALPPSGLVDRECLLLAGKRTAVFAGAMAACGFALYLPFWQSFDTQASGILPVLGPATKPVHFLLTMGMPALVAASAVAMAVRLAGVPSRRVVSIVGAAAAVPLLVWMVSATAYVGVADETPELARRIVTGRLMLALPLLLAAAAAAYAVVALTLRRENASLRFSVALVAVGFGLLAGAELFRIDDQFGNRMNTVFKVYYQSWLLLWIGGLTGCVAGLKLGLGPGALRVRRLPRRLAVAGVAVLALASMYYPAGAVVERTGWLSYDPGFEDNSLSALAHVKRHDVDEYRAIRWLRAQPGHGNIVEALGNSYSAHGRVAAATGRPTILNWPGHERQWRGEDLVLYDREQAVSEIYLGEDTATRTRLLDQYKVEYVVLGHREMQLYGDAALPKMEQMVEQGRLSEAFRSGDTIVYRFQQQEGQ